MFSPSVVFQIATTLVQAFIDSHMGYCSKAQLISLSHVSTNPFFTMPCCPQPFPLLASLSLSPHPEPTGMPLLPKSSPVSCPSSSRCPSVSRPHPAFVKATGLILSLLQGLFKRRLGRPWLPQGFFLLFSPAPWEPNHLSQPCCCWRCRLLKGRDLVLPTATFWQESETGKC